MVKVLYKGKADMNDIDKYRGLAPECSPLEVLSRLLTKRLQVTTEIVLPDEQFGFRPGSSPLHAATKLLGEKEDALKQAKGKLYAIFIGYSKSFNLLDRVMITSKR
jgi:hypothetical protein